MPVSRCALTALFLAGATGAAAEVPNVVTDFGPTNAIVGRVMQGIGKPVALLLPNDAPHDFTLRDTHTQLLSEAEVVFWVGPNMTPWLSAPISTLPEDTTVLALLGTNDWTHLPMRDAQVHDNPTTDRNNATPAGGKHDPHAWLDPDIAAVWAMTIAETLSAVDPANSVIYQANANQFWADVALLGQEISGIVADIDSARILLHHDSLQYFEVRFGLAPAAFIAQGDALEPDPKVLQALREQIVAGELTCVLNDVDASPDTLAFLTEGTDAVTGTLDLTDRTSIGYVGMMQSIAASLAACAD